MAVNKLLNEKLNVSSQVKYIFLIYNTNITYNIHIFFFSDVVVQVVVEGVNVMLVTQEMELTAQVSFYAQDRD